MQKMNSAIAASTVAGVLGCLSAPAAWAGPIDQVLEGLIGPGLAYWAEAVVAVSALLGLASALIKDSALPAWAATVVNVLASNWGAAKNDPAENE